MENIGRVPYETVVNTVLENLIEGGVITKDEKDHFRPVVEAMDGQELIETLLDSHVLRENLKHLFYENLHLDERKN